MSSYFERKWSKIMSKQEKQNILAQTYLMAAAALSPHEFEHFMLSLESICLVHGFTISDIEALAENK